MRRSVILLLLCCSLLLTGCSWMDGSYVSVEPHREQNQNEQAEINSAANYLELMEALEAQISTGTETAVIYVADYAAGTVDNGMAVAVSYAMENYPIGAYAVEEIHYELGTSNGLPAVAISITYRHSLAEIQRIRKVKTAEEAETVVENALKDYNPSVVILVENYIARDFVQVVQDYAANHPDLVMETPQVTETLYGTSQGRVVELNFTYQNSRDSLRQMKKQVRPVFDAAELYVSGSGAQRQKFSQLYAFLMERFDYTIETSLTPAYSLLCHGVGDSRAFATVYAAMCRAAGLECLIVTGTRSGEPWTWNMVLDNDHYYHVDLLYSSTLGAYREFTDGEMNGYVWDYSAYPASVAPAAPSETQIPAEVPTEPAVTEREQEDFTLPTEEPEETTETTQPIPEETIQATEAPQETSETTAATEPEENFE